ncbi:MAG: hypothetical protein ACW99G_01590 [Candidatus Thorarchaeota archaeon]
MDNKEGLQKFQEKAFHHSISMICVEDAKDLAGKIGYEPILQLIENIEEENKSRETDKLGKLSVPAAFRKGLRKLRTEGGRDLRQKEQEKEREEHIESVKKEKDAGFRPYRDNLWQMVSGETEDVKRARRFLMTLPPIEGEPVSAEA